MNTLLNRVVLVALFGVAGYLAWSFQKDLLADKGRLKVYQSSLVPGAVEMAWKTSVDVPMAHRLNETFKKWRNKTDQIVINLHSPGGSLREGRLVIEVIEQMKKTHKVYTFVDAGRSCLSMCVPIYLHGHQRIAHPSSKWMFHEPRSVDFFTDEDIKEPEFERRRMVERFVERYFVNSPLEPTWRKNLLKSWKGKDIWRTGQQLVDEKSGVVTVLR